MSKKLVKFRHECEKGIFHYEVFEDAFVVLAEKKSSKIPYIRTHKTIDITFDVDNENYDVFAVDIIEDKEYVQKVYDFMTENDNNYFSDGFDDLVVLRFHQ